MSRDWSITRGGPTKEQALLVELLREAKQEAIRTRQSIAVRDKDNEILAVVSVHYVRDRDLSTCDPSDEFRPVATVELTKMGHLRLPRPWNT